MGSAIDAISESINLVKDNPLYILVTLATLFVATIIGGAISIIPIFGVILAIFVFAAIPATLVTALYFRASDMGTLFDGWKNGLNEYYIPVLGGTLAYQVVNTGIILLGGFLFAVMVGFSALGATSDMSVLFSAVGVGGFLVMIVTLILIFTVSFIAQFIDVSVIIGGNDGAIKGLKGAFHFVRDQPVSVTGYSLLRFTIPNIVVGIYLAIGGGITAISEAVGYVFLTIVGIPIFLAIPAWMFAYHVAYYMDATGERTASETV